MKRWLLPALIIIATVLLHPIDRRLDFGLYDSGFEPLQIAESLVRHGAFANPFQPLPTGPTAHAAPAFPAFVAALIHVTDSEGGGTTALQLAALLALATQLALLPALAKRLGIDEATGAMAAFLLLISGVETDWLWEASYAGLLIVLAMLLVERRASSPVGERRQARTPVAPLVAGTVWGVLLLVNPAPIVVMPFVERRRRAMLVALLVIAPWLVRNAIVFRHPVFLRDNLGIELAVSNNDCATYDFFTNRASNCFACLHPNESDAEAARLRAIGELAYNRERMGEALRWMQTHPRRFATLTMQRFAAFWFPDRGVAILTLLSVPGLWLLWRRERAPAMRIGAWLVLFPPVYYLTQWIGRYRTPVLWATMLPAAYAIVSALRLCVPAPGARAPQLAPRAADSPHP
jgi:hypothetical protein